MTRTAVAVLALLTLTAKGGIASPQGSPTPRPLQVSILVYHRFGPVVADESTIRTTTFRAQMKYLRDHRYVVVPLRAVVAYLQGTAPPPPPRAVVLTADDGHESVFTDMQPVVRDFGVPVTLFIYPSAISNAPYAMTWAQLDALRRTGLFEIQSHTFWHPKFSADRRRLRADDYRAFVTSQLTRSRRVLADRLGVDADLLAWPFGIHDDELMAIAHDAGYVAAFTIDRRLVSPDDHLFALPRFLVTDVTGPRFAAMLPPEER